MVALATFSGNSLFAIFSTADQNSGSEWRVITPILEETGLDEIVTGARIVVAMNLGEVVILEVVRHHLQEVENFDYGLVG